MKKFMFFASLVIFVLACFCGCQSAEQTGGNIHLKQGRYDRAIEQYKEAAKKYPNNIGTLVALSSAYYMKKDYKESIAYIDKARKIDKEGTDGKFKEYEDLLKTQYLKWQIYYNGAVGFFEEDSEKALELAKKSLEVEDKEKISLSYSLMAKMNLNIKKLAEAKELYAKAMEADKNNIEPYLYLGHYFLSESKSKDALKYFNEALAIDSTKIEIYELIGQAYLLDKNYDKAVKALEKAVSVSGKSPTALYNLMLGYYEGKRYDSAIKTGKDILGMDNVEKRVLTKVYNLMGEIYKDKKDYKTAIATMKEAIDKNLNDCYAYSVVAFAYNKLGNRSESNVWAKKWEQCEKKQ